jgi:hypothetical protein
MLYGSPIQVCSFFGELVDRLQLSLFSISFLDYSKLSLIIYIRKYHNGLPFWHSAQKIVSTFPPQYHNHIIETKYGATKTICQ